MLESIWKVAGYVRVLLPLLLLVCTGAMAQEISVNLFINHGTAYRDSAWAPVDVLVENRLRDIDGFVEVRLYDAADRLQHPIYRLPAQSPAPSTKRFRLHCLFVNTARIEARLYHGAREVEEGRSWMGITPIGAQDFLCLVLDDKPEHYGFLSSALYEGQDVRYYRETLNSGQLQFLADLPQCYAPFDVIILGDIDPERVSPHHREVLERYVRGGGTLAVFTGEHAGRLADSWVAELAGVSIGAKRTYSEDELAARVFSQAPDADAHPERSGELATLTPVEEYVARLGRDPVLAVRRPLGDGQVVTFALDAASGLLTRNTGYHTLWRQLNENRNAPPEINLHNARRSLYHLPFVAGVELVPAASVIMFLVLYFLVAIVGNWVFWNYYKRREYAWVCLVLLSFAFTGYAMFYGTQGRAGRTELEQIELLHVPCHTRPMPGEADCAYTGLVGVLAKGSATYSGGLTRDTALAAGFEAYLGGMSGGETGPFYFYQGDPGRIEGMHIGASAMRLLRIDDRILLPGALRGTAHAAGARIEAAVVNETGIPFNDVIVMYNDAYVPLEKTDTGWESTGSGTMKPTQAMPPGIGGAAQGMPGGNEGFARWRESFRTFLFSFDPNTSPPPSQQTNKDEAYLLAYADAPPLGAFVPEQGAEANLHALLVIARLPLANTQTEFDTLDWEGPAAPPTETAARERGAPAHSANGPDYEGFRRVPVPITAIGQHKRMTNEDGKGPLQLHQHEIFNQAPNLTYSGSVQIVAELGGLLPLVAGARLVVEVWIPFGLYTPTELADNLILVPTAAPGMETGVAIPINPERLVATNESQRLSFRRFHVEIPLEAHALPADGQVRFELQTAGLRRPPDLHVYPAAELLLPEGPNTEAP
ncbi:MAG: hypothetical protein ACLFTT_10025 [Candidatus Hydrogenedentota bacterium]